MKKRIMLVIGICFLLAGCRAVTAKSDSVALDSATKQLQKEEQPADINGTEAVTAADGMIRTTMDDLQNIQRMIFEHRKGCYAIPDFIYKLFKDNDEDKAHREACM